MTEPTYILRGGHPGAATALRFFASIITDDPQEAARCQRLAREFDDFRRGRTQDVDLGDGLTGSAPAAGQLGLLSAEPAIARGAEAIEVAAANVALSASQIPDHTRPCKSCKKPIFDALLKGKKHPQGRRHPVDVEPVPGGNLEFDNDGRMHVVRPGGDPHWVSHFATCEQATGWRERAPR